MYFPRCWFIQKFKNGTFLCDNYGAIMTHKEWNELKLSVEESYEKVSEETLTVWNTTKYDEFQENLGSNSKLTKDKENLQNGYVYIIECNGIYKIGKTKNWQQRFRGFSTSLPYEFTVVSIIKTNNKGNLEFKLHEMFRDQRVRGEWFLLLPKDIDYVKGLSNEQL